MKKEKVNIMRTQLYDFMNDLEKVFSYDEGIKRIPVDVLQTEYGYQVIGEAPGLSKDNFEITFENGFLTIVANVNNSDNKNDDTITKYLIKERKPLSLKRVLNFGDINEKEIKAKYENGLLTIDIIVNKEEKIKKSIMVE